MDILQDGENATYRSKGNLHERNGSKTKRRLIRNTSKTKSIS